MSTLTVYHPSTVVAQHLIQLAALEPECEPMTPSRLHKLLYYCQGWHLAWYGRPLFPEAIEARQHGPFVPNLAHLQQGCDPLPDIVSADELPPDAARSVQQVWRHFRQFSACGLRDQIQREAPWRDHYQPDRDEQSDRIIPANELAAYFGAEYRRLTGDASGAECEADQLISHDRLMAELDW